MNAPPTASDCNEAPATLRARMSAIPIVSSRLRNPNVPAVAGSIRRRKVGPTNRPIARASPQPRATTAITATIRTGVVSHCTFHLCRSEMLTHRRGQLTWWVSSSRRCEPTSRAIMSARNSNA